MMRLSTHDAKPLYEQIMDNYRRLIVSGGISPGEQLPSVRELATQLAINPNTIQRAYRELESEGYIITLPGKGSFVTRSPAVDESRMELLWSRLDRAASELAFAGASIEDICRRVREGAPHD